MIETDCEVDFAPPLDYVEPSREIVDEDEPMNTQEEAGTSQTEETPEEPKFQAFVGAGRRLDGKASATPPATQPVPSSSAGKPGMGHLLELRPPLHRSIVSSKFIQKSQIG